MWDGWNLVKTKTYIPQSKRLLKDNIPQEIYEIWQYVKIENSSPQKKKKALCKIICKLTYDELTQIYIGLYIKSESN